MKTIFNKLTLLLLALTVSGQTVASFNGAGKFVTKVGGTFGTLGGGAAYFAHKYPNAMDKLIAFKNAGSVQTPSQPIIVQPAAQAPQSSAALESLAEGASAVLPYLTKKNIAVGSIVFSTVSVAIGYYKSERMKRWVNNTIKKATGTITKRIDDLQKWTKEWFEKLKKGQKEIKDEVKAGKKETNNRLDRLEKQQKQNHKELKAGLAEIDRRLPTEDKKRTKTLWQRLGFLS